MTQTGLQQAIEIPLRYELSKAGVQWCSRNRVPVRDFTASDGNRATGFAWNSVRRDFLVRLVRNRLLRGIDSQRDEFVSVRRRLLQVIEAVLEGLLLEKLHRTLRGVVAQSETVSRIMERTRGNHDVTRLNFAPDARDRLLQSNARAIRTIQHALLFEPFAVIDGDAAIAAADREQLKGVARRFLQSVDASTWILYSLVQPDTRRLELTREASQRLLGVVREATIVDTLGLIVMELVQDAERSHLGYLASRDSLSRQHQQNIAELARDAGFRSRLLALARQRNLLMSMALTFEPTNRAEEMPLSISISHAGEAVRGSAQGSAPTSLADVYTERGEANLAAMYLQTFEAACASYGILLETSVRSAERKTSTEISLKL